MDMQHSGAEALKREFARLLHPGHVDEDVLHLPQWDLRVRMRLEEFDEGRPSIGFRATTHLDRLAHPVEDYEIGMGASRRDAVQMAANMYMGSVFPVVHSLCCEKGSEYGVENRPFVAADADSGIVRDWRLVLGPYYLLTDKTTNATLADVPRDVLSDLLKDEFSELAREPGTYWFKCFAGRTGDTVGADCFLNNQEFTLGKERLTEFARTIPREKNFLTVKQHILVQPMDPAVLLEYRQRRRQSWRAASDRTSATTPPADIDLVLDALEAFHDCAGLDSDQVFRKLVDRGVAAESAQKLMGFLPAACARDFWRAKSFPFGSEYTLVNFRTGRSLSRPLNGEPLFQASLAVVVALREAEIAAGLLSTIRSHSSEDGFVRQAAAQGLKPVSTTLIVPTDDDVEGEINDELLKLLGHRRKPWWRFW
jgi:hypothetical protein